MKFTGMKNRITQGLVLALGAPVGWLLIQVLLGSSLADELASNPFLYMYLLIPTAIAFGSFGAAIGFHEGRLEEANHRLKEMSFTDPLTGLKNLRYFHSRLEEAYEASKREGIPLAIALIDLDRFKVVNDEYGHQVGDDVLGACGEAILSVARKGETAARVGGEEFAILLPGEDGEAASQVAERIREAIGLKVISTDAGPVRITASVGVASTVELGPIEPKLVYWAADSALYRAKREGRNRVALALPSELDNRYPAIGGTNLKAVS